ncbi:hypothetical protein Cgig2_008625 [Carnegiea gigantea]|uniref:Uncharacterized protein n=1 Tax=Carnegiea gigantea TaxID=171969 RepID=A0A9Q1QAB3_9CARY|nr:hypothetical protein Cgig2_008625 [Carnegiea gigantea]
MITHKQITTNAISGKTARACESCLKSRARWFCPADDAFLCHACDSVVHSANELAGRHKRVRLQPASFKPPVDHDSNDDDILNNNNHSAHSMTSHLPTWHHGFQKKARTPRNMKRAKSATEKHAVIPVVPEMSSDEESVEEENEEQIVFSVPTFDPFEVPCDDEFNISLIGFEGEGGNDHGWGNLPGFDYLSSENDLAEFAADVENLLERGVDEEVHSTIPLAASKETDSERILPLEKGFLKNEAIVKVEDEQEEDAMIENCDCQFEWAMDLENEVLNFEASNGKGNCGVGEEDEEKEKKVVVVAVEPQVEEDLLGNAEGKNKRRKISLRLNYEEVINAWPGSLPWTTGHRPEFDPDHDGWPNYMGGVDPLEGYYQGGGIMGGKRNVEGGDDGRQARVSRYREKRRTRLFSKKIRYEVRKLNAENRPRLKGRFVKQTSLTPVERLGRTFPHMYK